MPWCPKCKQEYQHGITTCPDCNEPLVDSLEPEYVDTELEFYTEEDTKRFIEFLSYSNIKNSSIQKDPVLEVYHILSTKEDKSNVQKLFSAYSSVEKEDMSEEAEDETQGESAVTKEASKKKTKKSSIYHTKKEEYEDMHSTGVMLLIISILGFIYVALNIMDVLSLLHGILPIAINLILFTAALLYSIHCLISSTKIKAQIEPEEKLRKEIKESLETLITEDFLTKVSDSSLPEEANYLKQYDAAKEIISKKYPDVAENLIENLLDSHMSQE